MLFWSGCKSHSLWGPISPGLISIHLRFSVTSKEIWKFRHHLRRVHCSMSCLMNLYLKVLYVAVRNWNSFPKIDEGMLFCMLIFEAINKLETNIRIFFFLVLYSWQAVTNYIDQQYETYLQDESGLNRRHIVDNRVHCCLYFICPHGHGLVFAFVVDFLRWIANFASYVECVLLHLWSLFVDSHHYF